MGRIQSVETLRGLAIIAVVMLHVIMRYGYKFEDTGIYSSISPWLLFISMPLFAGISGLVLGLSRKDFTSFEFLKQKAKRLLIPFYVVGTFQYAITIIFHKITLTGDDLYQHLVEGRLRFYFLMSIFTIFTFSLVAGRLKLMEKPWQIISLMIGFAALTTLPHIAFMALSHSFFLGIYFLLAYLLGKFPDLIQKKTAYGLISLFAAIGVGLWLGMTKDMAIENRHDIPVIIFGVFITFSILVLFIQHNLNSRILSKIGSYSFGIFILHGFFLPVVDRILFALGFENVHVHILLTTFICTLGSIVAQEILASSTMLRKYFFGAAVPKGYFGK